MLVQTEENKRKRQIKHWFLLKEVLQFSELCLDRKSFSFFLYNDSSCNILTYLFLFLIQGPNILQRSEWKTLCDFSKYYARPSEVETQLMMGKKKHHLFSLWVLTFRFMTYNFYFKNEENQ